MYREVDRGGGIGRGRENEEWNAVSTPEGQHLEREEGEKGLAMGRVKEGDQIAQKTRKINVKNVKKKNKKDKKPHNNK